MKNNVRQTFKQIPLLILRYIVLRHMYYLPIVAILFRPFGFLCYVNLYYMYNVHCIFRCFSMNVPDNGYYRNASLSTPSVCVKGWGVATIHTKDKTF